MVGGSFQEYTLAYISVTVKKHNDLHTFDNKHDKDKHMIN
jgi:hypothetical protein